MLAVERTSAHSLLASVAERHHFYAAPAPGENFDAATAPAPTLLKSRLTIFKVVKGNLRSDILFFLILSYENCGKYA
jgi:hypothetical protein